VRLSGFRELHAPFLKERRTRGHVQGSVQEIRGISLVFREMWESTTINFFLERLTNKSETGRLLHVRQSSSPKPEAAPNKNLLGFLLLNALKEGQP
jgi:hypothetical protein